MMPLICHDATADTDAVITKFSMRRSLALLTLAALFALLVAGCGGGSSPGSPSSTATASNSGESTTGADAPKTIPATPLEPGYADWPYFGRVPQRTHYLPTRLGSIDRPLDPPLKVAWQVNTHGLIEFPPAIGRASCRERVYGLV